MAEQLARITVRGWALWRLPNRGLIAYVLIIDILALAGVVAALFVFPVPSADLVPFVLLTTCAVVYTELSRPIELMREGRPFIDLNSVWMFAAILLLHPALSAVVIAVSYFSRWLRVQANELYRRIFSTAATIIASYAASAFYAAVSDVPFDQTQRDMVAFGLVVGAGLVFLIVNSVLIAVAIRLSSAHEKITPAEYAIEAATVALGIMLAWALTDWPIVLLLIIGITLVLHRSVLIRQLREQARSDPKTGLLNALSWTKDAAAELDRGTGAALLMLDLDNFKSINDRYGHLVGDEHLKGVAEVLRSEVRGTDMVGRFGGEEFVILLPETTEEEAMAVAERIRRRVAAFTVEGLGTVTVSVGVAVHPEHGATLEEVMNAADLALLAAKTAGRNRTLRFAAPPA